MVNGATEVNRETYGYIQKTFRFSNINYSVAATLDPSSVKPGQARTIVVLNTGITSGVDPALAKFIAGFPEKKNVFLVNLYHGRTDLTVTTFTAGTSSEGVDGVTAASAWRGTWGGADPQQMHQQWMQAFVKFLKRA